MKVTRHTPEQLILDHAPWLLSLVIIAAGLGAAAMSIYLLSRGNLFGLGFVPVAIVSVPLLNGFARRSQAIFDVPSNSVTLKQRSLTKFKTESFALSDVETAELDVSVTKKRSDGTGTQKTFRPALRIDNALVPLQFLSTQGGRHEEVVEIGNAWLSSHRSGAKD